MILFIAPQIVQGQQIKYEESFDKAVELSAKQGKTLAVLITIQPPVYSPDYFEGLNDRSVVDKFNGNFINYIITFLIVAFAGGLGISAVNTYLFPYLTELGMKESMMGLTLALGTLSEIPVLFFGNRLIGRFKPYRLFALACVVTGVRLLLFAASEKVGVVLILQLFAGLTFPVLWIAGLAYSD